MVSIGILESSENILWFSSSTMIDYRNLINHACSFALNIQDGRLEGISHTPFKENSMYLDEIEPHHLLVVTKTMMDKKEEIILYFCLDYAESEMKNKELAQKLLDLFVDKFFEKFVYDLRHTSRFLENIKKNNEEFTRMCDEIFKEVIMCYDLFTAEGIDFLINPKENESKELILLFAAVSVQGLPITAKFFDSITSNFKVSIKEEDNTKDILENLISAQLSALSYQALVQGTMCNNVQIKFTDFASMNERNLTVSFFPISENIEELLNADDFSFIMMSEGDPNLARFFSRTVTPMFLQTGLLSEKFTGNVVKYKSLDAILSTFPKKMNFDDEL
ncbi:MAG: hypothetical protein ACFFCS_13640 [Candidatus Hodarchaeota archaeon]